MARLSSVARAALSLLIYLGLSLAVDYGDDSDYVDYVDYVDYRVLLPERRASASQQLQDDLYIASEEAMDRTRRVSGTRGVASESMDAEERRPMIDRVYRYTKHRIPGYDYEELDFPAEGRQSSRCDERSVWTHCLCQFTCAKPSIVDCYSPCISGCECREDYVYDGRTGQCVHLEQCQPLEDYMLY